MQDRRSQQLFQDQHQLIPVSTSHAWQLALYGSESHATYSLWSDARCIGALLKVGCG